MSVIAVMPMLFMSQIAVRTPTAAIAVKRHKLEILDRELTIFAGRKPSEFMVDSARNAIRKTGMSGGSFSDFVL